MPASEHHRPRPNEPRRADGSGGTHARFRELPLSPPEQVAVDFEARQVTVDGDTSYSIDSPEAFAALSRAWLWCGWVNKHIYTFTWLGRPIIQLPEDMIRLQELIYTVRPDVIVETGIAHGGSLVFYASLCRLLERGRVIGVDIEIRPHTREALEGHELFPLITPIEGNSIDREVVDRVGRLIAPEETVLVLLDSAHRRDHVRAELEAYAPLVSTGSYIVAMDGIMELVAGAPRAPADWAEDNPARAAGDFAAAHPEFALEDLQPLFDEGNVRERITHSPGGFLRRLR